MSSSRRLMSSTVNAGGGIPRVCIVGAGPSGFYCAKYLTDYHKELRVDIIEQLPTPYGLVRYGVAPDHEGTKSVQKTFREIAERERVRYFGNIRVGRDVSVKRLREQYSAVIMATGANASSRRLMIPGEEDFAIPARDFVNYVNGHPHYQYIGDQIDFSKVQRVVIIGHGNVAIDCARILAKTAEELQETDISVKALEQLRLSALERIDITGRRSHVQCSFTIKELRELSRLPHAVLTVCPEEIQAGTQSEESQRELQENRPRQRLSELIESFPAEDDVPFRGDDEEVVLAGEVEGGKFAKKQRLVKMRFFLRPVKIVGTSEDQSQAKVGFARSSAGMDPAVSSIDSSSSSSSSGDINSHRGRASGVIFEKTALTGGTGSQRAVGTGILETIPCQLVLTSVGYRSESLPGCRVDPVSSTVPHSQGRVLSLALLDSETEMKGDADRGVVAGLYVTGWLKRGPVGIIGTNIPDAKETVQSLLEDLSKNLIYPVDQDPFGNIFKGLNAVTWEDYKKLETEEERRGSEKKKPREKILTVEEQLTHALG